LESLLRGGAYLNNRHPLRLNIGFLLHKDVGFSRNFDFECNSIRLGDDLDVTDLRGTLQMSRTGQGVYVHGRIQANTSLDCVRCLTSFKQPLVVDLKDLFAYPADHASDPLLSIPESGLLDLNPLLREYFLLDIPIQPLCSQDCKGLCPECGGSLNEAVCDHPASEVDPRFAVLKALLKKS
jgi:uncharacterized protein